MKRIIITLIAFALVLGLAWLVPHSLFNVTMVTATPTAVPTAAPTEIATEATPGDIQEGYENVFFTIPAGLAYSAVSETVPASDGPLNPYPAFIRFTLQGYQFLNPNGYYPPEVRVYPVADYIAVNTSAAESLKRLKNLLANPTAPMENDKWPMTPFMTTSAQLYAAQVKVLPFANGMGARMISSHAQFPAPIGRNDSFYHYEGLTQDGKYYVVVVMPVTLPVYSDASNPGEYGVTYPSNYKDWADVDPYYQAMTNLLNQASPEGFNPMLGQLDALVQSIQVLPPSTTAQKFCPTPTSGTLLLEDTEYGTCLLYPEAYSTEYAHLVIINPTHKAGDQPGDAWLSIVKKSAAGQTAAQVANEKIAAVGQGFNVTQFNVMVGGEQAVVVDGLPGQDSTRIVYLVHAENLYTLTFTPWYPAAQGAGQLTPLEDLYKMTVESFHFMP